jgi:uncharacterized tellurite resistance protein B-like protein
MLLTSESWTSIHDMALLFLSLTHGTDAQLDDEEAKLQSKHLSKWFPRAEEAVIEQTMNEVMLTYMADTRDQMVETAAESLRQSLSESQRLGVLNDLAALATADGQVAATEAAYIQRLASYWNVRIS